MVGVWERGDVAAAPDRRPRQRQADILRLLSISAPRTGCVLRLLFSNLSPAEQQVSPDLGARDLYIPFRQKPFRRGLLLVIHSTKVAIPSNLDVSCANRRYTRSLERQLVPDPRCVK